MLHSRMPYVAKIGALLFLSSSPALADRISETTIYLGPSVSTSTATITSSFSKTDTTTHTSAGSSSATATATSSASTTATSTATGTGTSSATSTATSTAAGTGEGSQNKDQLLGLRCKDGSEPEKKAEAKKDRYLCAKKEGFTLNLMFLSKDYATCVASAGSADQIPPTIASWFKAAGGAKDQAQKEADQKSYCRGLHPDLSSSLATNSEFGKPELKEGPFKSYVSVDLKSFSECVSKAGLIDKVGFQSTPWKDDGKEIEAYCRELFPALYMMRWVQTSAPVKNPRGAGKVPEGEVPAEYKSVKRGASDDAPEASSDEAAAFDALPVSSGSHKDSWHGPFAEPVCVQWPVAGEVRPACACGAMNYCGVKYQSGDVIEVGPGGCAGEKWHFQCEKGEEVEEGEAPKKDSAEEDAPKQKSVWVYIGSNMSAHGKCSFDVGTLPDYKDRGECSTVGTTCNSQMWNFSNSQVFTYECRVK